MSRVSPQPLRALLPFCTLLALSCGEGDGSRTAADAGEVPLLPPRIDEHSCRPDADYLVGGGRSFGSCQGECRFDLSLSSVFDLFSSECTGFRATLRVFDPADVELYVAQADLGDAAWDRAGSLGAALRQQLLDKRYGCPDCNDGGAAWVSTLPASSDPQPSVYELRRPPAPLVAVDAFVQGLIDQLRSCTGPDLLLCSRDP